MKTRPAGRVASRPNTADTADLAREAKDQVDTILQQTNWNQYWSDVSDQAEQEINAYNAACARSLACASRKFVH